MLWCCFLVLAGVWLWCRRRPWCRLALAHNPLHRLSKAMNGGHSAYSPCKSTSHKGTVWLARVIKPPSWGRRARAFQLLRVFWNLPPSQCVNIANWWQQAPQSFSCQDHQQMILISSDWSFWPLMVSNFCWSFCFCDCVLFLHFKQEASGGRRSGNCMELLKNKKLGNIDHSWNQHLEQGILNTTNNTSIVVIFGILIKFGSYCICVAANFVLLCVF